jgi:hypothetical protein
VHDRHVVEITCGSLGKETYTPDGVDPISSAKNVADLETDSVFQSAYRYEKIPHTGNNWVCYDFKERRIVPMHYTIRKSRSQDLSHPKSWRVETSADGKNWRVVASEGNDGSLNYAYATFSVPSGEECRFIRLVNIGKNSRGDDCLCISAWEIFGILVE